MPIAGLFGMHLRFPLLSSSSEGDFAVKTLRGNADCLTSVEIVLPCFSGLSDECGIFLRLGVDNVVTMSIIANSQSHLLFTYFGGLK